MNLPTHVKNMSGIFSLNSKMKPILGPKILFKLQMHLFLHHNEWFMAFFQLLYELPYNSRKE